MKETIILPYRAPHNVAALANKKFDAFVADSELNTDEIIQLAVSKYAKAMIVVPKQKITREVISHLPSTLKVIATSSVGFDHLDIPGASIQKTFCGRLGRVRE